MGLASSRSRRDDDDTPRTTTTIVTSTWLRSEPMMQSPSDDASLSSLVSLSGIRFQKGVFKDPRLPWNR